jgi:DNA replication protein DnaC
MQEQLMTQLRKLRLGGMASALRTQQEQPANYEDLSFIERLQWLVDYEMQERDHRKQNRLIKNAQFKLRAQPQSIEYPQTRGLVKSQMAHLLLFDWIKKAQNLLITGPCGCGKTYIACAIGYQACMKDLSVRYYRLPRLVLTLKQAKADGTYNQVLKRLSSYDLLMIDDWGIEPLTAAARNDLMEIMDDRYGHTSTLVISQLPTDQWYQSIGDNTLADAILDRLMHNAHRINLKGESMRKKMNSLTQDEHLE